MALSQQPDLQKRPSYGTRARGIRSRPGEECDDEDCPESRSDVRDAADLDGLWKPPVDWDQWWKDRLSQGTSDMFPWGEAPQVHYRGRYYDVVNRDDLLVATMTDYGLRTVLCAGSGVSQEPRALAQAGFDVTALDLSTTAMAVAKACEPDSRGFSHFCPTEPRRPGGHVDFVVGDFLDTPICPGPFDVIIERRTVQRLRAHERGMALEALAGRLSAVGIFLSDCNDDGFPEDLGYAFHETGYFHASESWFRERCWTIWDEVPSSTLSGRVAWLIRSGTIKPPRSYRNLRK